MDENWAWKGSLGSKMWPFLTKLKFETETVFDSSETKLSIVFEGRNDYSAKKIWTEKVCEPTIHKFWVNKQATIYECGLFNLGKLTGVAVTTTWECNVALCHFNPVLSDPARSRLVDAVSPIECLTHVWSIKYRLFIKLKTQLKNNLWDKSFKPN
jgi:hypothetical protein